MTEGRSSPVLNVDLHGTWTISTWSSCRVVVSSVAIFLSAPDEGESFRKEDDLQPMYQIRKQNDGGE